MVLPPSSWTSRSGPTIAWERPLGPTELGFYWDGVYSRTADTLQQAEVQVHPSRSSNLFQSSRVAKTWAHLKHRFPLLGAVYETRGEGSLFFVVFEENLCTIRSGEITFLKISSSQEAANIADDIVVKEQLLSDSLLACIFILERTDFPGLFHILIHVAHTIIDGMSNITLLKTFLDELCHETFPEIDLNHRLQLSVASEDLMPQLKFSLARRRWRKAIASVLSSRRVSSFKGGHTLPRKVSQITPYTPPRSKTLHRSFTPEKSILIINNCRRNRLTFGNAYPILGQIALTRVLVRRYLRGEIDEKEWQFRIREPMTSAGPLNLRPFLDKEWLQAGGLTNVCVSIGFFFFALPTMPLGASRLHPGMEMPSFGTLLSKKRFLLRSTNVKNQSNRYTKHPLFLEFLEVGAPARVQRNMGVGRQWRNEGGPPNSLSNRALSPMEQAAAGLIFSNGGSSMGNTDRLLPKMYPINGNGGISEPPLLQLKSSPSRLRCRPMELYLGASTSQDQLTLSVHWDDNVYAEDVVMEWLDEVKMAAEFYLGSEAEEHVQAKL